MAIMVQCPSCGVNSPAADSLTGRSVRCKKCGSPFVVQPTLDSSRSDTKKNPPVEASNPFPQLPAEFGRYRVLRLLGKGGMGAVYLAKDSQLGREVALKLPFFDAKESPQRAERFVREARSAAALHHPNICTVFDAGRINGTPFLTMAFVRGTPLDRAIDPESPMPQARAAEIARKVALGMAHAHSKGIVHRDLKPANVILDESGEPVVMDFGLAKRGARVDSNEAKRSLNSGTHDEAKLTRDGGVIGTPSYMSPEQVRGDAADIGPQTDVYSLGVLLFEMITGQTPYSGGMGAVMGKILAAPVPPLAEFRVDADPRLNAICQTGMAKSPGSRFPSMTAFAQALGEYLTVDSEFSVELVEPAAPQWPAPAVAPTVEYRPIAAPLVAPFDELTGEEPPVRRHAKKKAGGWNARRIGIAVGVALGVLVPLVWLASYLLRVETPNGTLIVEIADDEVETKMKGGKLVVSGLNGKPRYTLSTGERDKKLDAGAYTIRVEGADGLVLDTPEFTLKKGGKVTVRVTLEKKEVAKAEPRPVAKAEPKPALQPPIEPNPAPEPATGPKPPAVVQTDGFVALFNDKDLTGWKSYGKPAWAWVDGRLVSTPAPDKSAGFLMTEASYTDYEIELEYKASAGIGSGLFLRADPNGPVSGAEQFEIQIMDDGFPAFQSTVYKTGSVFGAFARKADPKITSGDWNEFRVKLSGRKVEVWLNGTQTIDANLDDARAQFGKFPGLARATGRIGLQQNQNADLQFRNLRVKKLDGTDPGAAIPVNGFVPIFNGKDLTGWAVDGASKKEEWKVADGVVSVAGGPSQTWGFLLTEKDYTDFVLKLQFQQRVVGAKSGIVIRGIPGQQFLNLPYQCKVNLNADDNTGAILWSNDSRYHKPTKPSQLKPAGEWNDAEVELRGQNLRVAINGVTVQEVKLDDLSGSPKSLVALKRPAGRIGLQKHLGDVAFRNIEIKELPAGEAGFVSLFNGKDLTGWKTHASQPGNWRVVNGVLIGASPNTSHLYTNRDDYRNFHLRIEARVNKGGNSGVNVRVPFGPTSPQVNPRWVLGYNIKLDGNRLGGLLAGEDPLLNRDLVSAAALGEWMTLEVIAVESNVVVKINGTTTADYTDPKRLYASGHIALQQHTATTVAEFRKVEVKELPAEKPPEPKLPPKADAFVPLFNGKDLTGWKGLPQLWTVRNGTIIGSSNPNGIKFNTCLCTEKEYGDFELKTQLKITGGTKANSGIQFRSKVFDGEKFIVEGPQCDAGAGFWGSLYGERSGGMMQAADAAVVARALKPDKFNELYIRCVGKRVTIKLNGVTTVDREFDGLPASGIIGLQLHSGDGQTAEFKDIQIKSQDGK